MRDLFYRAIYFDKCSHPKCFGEEKKKPKCKWYGCENPIKGCFLLINLTMKNAKCIKQRHTCAKYQRKKKTNPFIHSFIVEEKIIYAIGNVLYILYTHKTSTLNIIFIKCWVFGVSEIYLKHMLSLSWSLILCKQNNNQQTVSVFKSIKMRKLKFFVLFIVLCCVDAFKT